MRHELPPLLSMCANNVSNAKLDNRNNQINPVNAGYFKLDKFI